MILIDKTKPSTRLIVTVTNVNPADQYTLVLHSNSSNKTYSFELPANTSAHPQRYDEFVMDTEQFQGLGEGRYSYAIKAGYVTAEVGLAMVVGEAEQFISIEASEEDDDLIILT